MDVESNGMEMNAAKSSPSDVRLFSPWKIRGVELRNRVAVSPMCQYCATEGMADDWHLVHLGSRAAGGAGLVMVEATAVTRDGRISPGDMGIWSDAHTEPLARIARFVKSQGAVASIQLAHAGRKASCDAPWSGGKQLKSAAEGGWETVAPSAVPFYPTDNPPRALDRAEIEEVIVAFEAATRRALQAGFQVIEIHAAHGYLLHEFLSPLANKRTDEFGGSFENRTRLLLTVAKRLRALIPAELPLFTRISATDWVEGGWNVDDSVALSRLLKDAGVDLMDVSSGAMTPDAKIPAAKGFQAPFAKRIRAEAGIATGAVGMITEAAHAEELLRDGSADLILLAREMLREPYWAIKAAQELGAEPSWPIQYGYAVKRR